MSGELVFLPPKKMIHECDTGYRGTVLWNRYSSTFAQWECQNCGAINPPNMETV